MAFFKQEATELKNYRKHECASYQQDHAGRAQDQQQQQAISE